jgi:excisionase family DNA binding protein
MAFGGITTVCPISSGPTSDDRGFYGGCSTSRHRKTGYEPARPGQLATVDELAARLRVDRATVYRLSIPYVIVGSRRRYRPEDVDAYVEARRVTAT